MEIFNISYPLLFFLRLKARQSLTKATEPTARAAPNLIGITQSITNKQDRNTWKTEKEREGQQRELMVGKRGNSRKQQQQEQPMYRSCDFISSQSVTANHMKCFPSVSQQHTRIKSSQKQRQEAKDIIKPTPFIVKFKIISLHHSNLKMEMPEASDKTMHQNMGNFLTPCRKITRMHHEPPAPNSLKCLKRCIQNTYSQ